MGLTAIVKPTHECNLSCKYCYIEDSVERGKMDIKTLEKTIREVAFSSNDKKANFIWHGGEPLLMGLDFYREVANICNSLRKKGYEITNGIQSNGTLVSEELLDFIEKENDFQLGMSLDGPKEINDKTRVYKDGKGAFEDIFRGVRMVNDKSYNGRVRRNHLGGGVIVVLNKKNINEVDKIYDFFKNERINIKINPLIISGSAKRNIQDLKITPFQYGRAINKLFDLWINDYNSIEIEPFTIILGNLMTGRPLGCNYSVSCRNNFVSIGPLGDIYPCGRFDGEKEFWMGNINTTGLEKALNSEVQKKLFQRTLESLEECSACDYRKICNAGCMHNAYIEGDIMGKDNYCGAYKKIFNHIKSFLHEELSKAEV